MTLSELLADLYARFGYASSPDSGVTDRFTRFLNETQREICSDPILQQWLIGTQSFDSVADTPQYGLPPSIARVLKIYDSVNRRTLCELSLDEYRTLQPDPSTPTGIPTHFTQIGASPVYAQPTSPVTLYVISTSASDTGTAYLEGVRTSGYAFKASVTMTGLTAASFGLTDISEVTKFYLSAAPVGDVYLTDTV